MTYLIEGIPIVGKHGVHSIGKRSSMATRNVIIVGEEGFFSLGEQP